MGYREKRAHVLFMRRSYQAYRALKERAGEELPFTLNELRILVELAINLKDCEYLGVLGEKVTSRNFSIDHATPVSRGGTHELENIVVCSHSANLAKGILTRVEFLKVVSVLKEMPPEASADFLGRLKAGGAVIRLRFLGLKKVKS